MFRRKVEVFFHFFAHLALTFEVLPKATVVITILPALLVAFKVVITGRAFLGTIGLAAVFNDLLNPPLFCLVSYIKRVMPIAAHMIYALGDMVALGSAAFR